MCGSPLDREDLVDEADPIVISLKFTVWDCDHCGEASMVDFPTVCSRCGVAYHLDGERNALLRLKAYGEDVEILGEQADGLQRLAFGQRGTRIDPQDYPRWCSEEVIEPCRSFLSCVKAQLSGADWDDVDDAWTRESWIAVKNTFADMRERILRLAATPAPIIFIATHRNLVRSAADAYHALASPVQ